MPNFSAAAQFPAQPHSFSARPHNSRKRPEPNFSATGAKFSRDRTVSRTSAHFPEPPHYSRNRPEPNFSATTHFSALPQSFLAQPRNSRNRQEPDSRATGAKFPRDRAVSPHIRRLFPHIRTVFPHSRAIPGTDRGQILARPAPNFRATAIVYHTKGS